MRGRLLSSPGFWILLLALAARLIYLRQISSAPTFRLPIVDSLVYFKAASRLASGRGLDGAFFFQPFLYPVWLAGVLKATGASIAAARVLQSLVGCLTCWLTWRLGRRILGPGEGIAAGVITALYGPSLFFESELVATGMAAFFCVALVLLFLEAARRKAPLLSGLAGLAGGAAVLARPTFLVPFAAGSLWLLYTVLRERRTGGGETGGPEGTSGEREGEGGRTLRGVRPKGASEHRALRVLPPLLAGFALAVLPAAAANRSVTGHFGFLPASGGLNLYLGNNPRSAETAAVRPGSAWSDITSLPKAHGVGGDMWARDGFYLGEVAAYAVSNPLSLLAGLGRKTLQFLSSREPPRNTDIYLFRKWSPLLGILLWKAGSFGFPFGLLLPLAAAGFLLARRRIPFIVPLWIAAFALSIILVFVAARYRAPVIPLLAIPAGAAVTGFARILRERRFSRIAAAAGVAAAAVLAGTLPGPFAAERMNYEAELHCSLAESLQQSGRIDEAAAQFEEALSLDPGYAGAYANLATLHIVKGERKAAVKALEKALEIDPGLVQARCNLAVLLREEGNLPEAEKQCLAGLALRPREEALHFNLAGIYAEEGRKEKAGESLRKVLEIDPDHGPAHRELARLLEKEGRIEEAIGHLEAAVRIAPDEEALNRLGGLLFRAGRYAEAAERFRAGLALRPGDASLLYNLARALESLGRRGEAAAFLRKALGIRPAFKEAASLLGNILVREGRPGEAVEPLSSAAAADPGNTAVRHTLAVALAGAGRYREAVEEYGKVLAADPGYLPSLLGLAWLEATCPDPGFRDGASAVALAEGAAAAAGGDPHVLDTLAAAYAEAGRFQEAAAAAEKAAGLAEKADLFALARKIKARLSLYRQKKPFRTLRTPRDRIKNREFPP